MNEPVRILIAEDSPIDAELAQREIGKTLRSPVFKRVETREDFLRALSEFKPDLIISDYRMPRFDGLTALKIALEQSPFTPVIILTGALNEDTAVECMKAGAVDYVIKEHIKRLSQAVVHALDQKRIRQDTHRAEQALKESEERYRTLINTVPDPIAVVDRNGTVTYASPAMLREYGYTPEELLGSRFVEWAHPNYQLKAFETMEMLMAGKEVHNQEYAICRKDGSVVFGEVSASCMKDESGKPIGSVVVIHDISERRRAEEERSSLQGQLLQSQKMESIGRLAGGVAHDFNNMLSVILGYTELIRTQLPAEDPTINDILQIERAGRRAKDITQQLLAFSRKQIIEPAILNLNDLIASTQKGLVRLIGEDIDLQFVPDPAVRKIKFDPSQLDQILINLAVNARDAMPKGGKLVIETSHIRVDGETVRRPLGMPPGDYVLLTVSDNGMGMDEETLAHAFEPFFTTKAVGKGTGLGLATVYGIVSQGGSFIEAFSTPGKGSSFRIYFPVVAEESEPESEAAASPFQAGTGTVLVVEDDAMVRDMAVAMLRASGYSVVAAASSRHALRYCEDGKPLDLLISDVVMPELSGADLRDRILALRPGTKVLFISGYPGDIIAHHGVLDEGVNFIRKPFSMGDLANAVQNAMLR